MNWMDNLAAQMQDLKSRFQQTSYIQTLRKNIENSPKKMNWMDHIVNSVKTADQLLKPTLVPKQFIIQSPHNSPSIQINLSHLGKIFIYSGAGLILMGRIASFFAQKKHLEKTTNLNAFADANISTYFEFGGIFKESVVIRPGPSLLFVGTGNNYLTLKRIGEGKGSSFIPLEDLHLLEEDWNEYWTKYRKLINNTTMEIPELQINDYVSFIIRGVYIYHSNGPKLDIRKIEAIMLQKEPPKDTSIHSPDFTYTGFYEKISPKK